MRLRREKTPRERQIEEALALNLLIDEDEDTPAESFQTTKTLAEVLQRTSQMSFIAGCSFGLFIGSALLLASASWWNAGWAALGAIACVSMLFVAERIHR